ncbi:MAG: 2Fe-2S iron-sulfur cluster-binding protein [Pseudomonadota bacterium]
MADTFHTLTVDRVRALTGDAVAIRFAVPETLRNQFEFDAGQYVTLRASIDGESVRRSYSICSHALDDGFEVGIKRVPDGRFSSFAQSLSVGDTLDVMPAQGRFVWNPDHLAQGDDDTLFLIAAGSGITPCLSIAKTALSSGAHVTLLYGNTRATAVMFRDDLVELKDRFTDRFSVLHCLSREQQNGALFNGRIDGERLAALADAGLIDPKGADKIYICGPYGLAQTAQDVLPSLGAVPDGVHVELFSAPDGHVAPAPVEDAVAGAEVTVLLDGTRQSLVMGDASQTVLGAAQNEGLDLPFSCAGGMCCTCRCKVVEGTADMVANYSLEPWEVEAGFILACQAQPTSERLVLDFDAV